MSFIIDAHEDMAYNAINFDRDYRHNLEETRNSERNTPILEDNDESVLGWKEYQQGQVAVIFSTLFITPTRYKIGTGERYTYSNPDEGNRCLDLEMNVYQRWTDENPEKYQFIRNKTELKNILTPWINTPSQYPSTTHPTGLVLLLEGAESIGKISELEHWWERGLRIIGPVWAGLRFCGGTKEYGGFTSEGYELLETMQQYGYTLDISHMTEKSALQAIDRYQGHIIASHANARALMNPDNERHLTDITIQRLVERGGVIGVIPYNRFLKPGWKNSDGRPAVTLNDVAAHIDHICQIAGNAKHAALGTDFDGGFGLQSIPDGLDSIKDLQKLDEILKSRGYTEPDIAAIMGTNWQRILENSLPE